MHAVSEGDLTKLGLLFERHHRRLYNYFYRWLGQAQRCEDLVQEVFCRILKYRQSYSEGQPFLPWFFRIAHNAGIDACRNSHQEMPLFEEFEPPAKLDQQEQLDKRADLKHLEKALGKLSPEKREIVILCRFHNLRYKQIAELLGCSVAAIKVRLHRALKELSLGYQQNFKETPS